MTNQLRCTACVRCGRAPQPSLAGGDLFHCSEAPYEPCNLPIEGFGPCDYGYGWAGIKCGYVPDVPLPHAVPPPHGDGPEEHPYQPSQWRHVLPRNQTMAVGTHEAQSQ